MIRKTRKWDATDEDPTAGLVNLFDIWMVFALALLLALVEAGVVRVAGNQPPAQAAASTNDSQRLEPLASESVKVTTIRVTRDKLAGEGLRLGTAYRLKSGEVVYVPDPHTPN